MTKLTEKQTKQNQMQSILDEAYAAAVAAQVGGQDTGACGFAWVRIDGTDPLARFCRAQIKAARKLHAEGGCGPQFVRDRERFYGDKGHPTGWQFWGPGDFRGQAVDVKEAGAKAFRDVLAKYGMRADVGSRLD